MEAYQHSSGRTKTKIYTVTLLSFGSTSTYPKRSLSLSTVASASRCIAVISCWGCGIAGTARTRGIGIFSMPASRILAFDLKERMLSVRARVVDDEPAGWEQIDVSGSAAAGRRKTRGTAFLRVFHGRLGLVASVGVGVEGSTSNARGTALTGTIGARVVLRIVLVRVPVHRDFILGGGATMPGGREECSVSGEVAQSWLWAGVIPKCVKSSSGVRPRWNHQGRKGRPLFLCRKGHRSCTGTSYWGAARRCPGKKWSLVFRGR
ncbi:hypothetical protein B0H12DRAFT_818733 [Mycena haematopus]|nr:hypothetical protein B0H12DRAFT_818733 [Mycena haematopus]